jgi:cobaltochelatase CobS
MSTDNELEDQLFDELMSEEIVVEEAVEKEDPLFAKQAKGKKAAGTKLFSEVVGIPAAGIDHSVTVLQTKSVPKDIRQYIPNKEQFKNYVPQPYEMEALLVGWEMNDRINIVGPTGAGKSSMVEYGCALTGRPFIRMQGRGDMESAALLGQMKVEGGDTVWTDGELTLGVREGAVVCIDEWTLIPPEILMSLQWLMEDGGKLLLTDMPAGAGERLIEPHPNFRLVCTDNTRGLGDDTGAFAATNVQNTATLDRFGTVIHVDYLSEAHELDVLTSEYPALTNRLGRMMIKFAGLVRDGYEQGELSLTMSPRTLLNWSKKALYYGDAALALKTCFYEKMSSDAERQAVAALYSTAFGQPFIKS